MSDMQQIANRHLRLVLILSFSGEPSFTDHLFNMALCIFSIFYAARVKPTELLEGRLHLLLHYLPVCILGLEF